MTEEQLERGKELLREIRALRYSLEAARCAIDDSHPLASLQMAGNTHANVDLTRLNDVEQDNLRRGVWGLYSARMERLEKEFADL